MYIRRFYPFHRRIAVALAMAALSVLTGLSIAMPAFAQDAPSQELLLKLVAYLSQTTGQTITEVQTYSYEAATFADTSLGCPQEGQVYAQVVSAGFIVRMTIQGVTHDLRTTLDGSTMAYCGAAILVTATPAGETPLQASPTPTPANSPTPLPPTETPLALYRTRQFSVPYPRLWNVTNRGADLYFGLANTPVCDQPGMLVASLGAAGGNTPEGLLAAYKPTVNRAVFAETQIPVRRTGLSTTYIAPCANGAPRAHRVTFFVAYGGAYRITQFAPEAEFPAWDSAWLEILTGFSPSVIGGSLGGGTAITRPDVSPLAAIAHLFAGNVYAGTLVDLPGTPITTGGSPDRAYRFPAVSPQGNLLAFVDPFERSLYVASLDGRQTRKVADNLAVSPHEARSYPPAWSPDGQSIAFVVGLPNTPAAYTLNVYSLAQGATRQVAPLGLPAGECPAAAPASVMRWLKPDALYFSGACGIGLLRMNPETGRVEAVDGALASPAFSPDGEAVIGIVSAPEPALVRLNLTNGKSETLLGVSEGYQPKMAVWDASGQFIYCVVERPQSAVTNPEGADLVDPAALDPRSLVITDVRLLRLVPSAGVATEVFGGAGGGIADLAPSPDGAGLLFALVPSAQAYVDALAGNAPESDLQRLLPMPQVYWLPTRGGPALLVAISSAPAWGPLNSAPAPTPTGGPPKGTPKATLTPPPTWTPMGATSTAVPTSRFGSPPPTNTPRR